MSGMMRLRIESANGALVNDYRVRGKRVEVRSLTPAGQPVPDVLGSWRQLDESDITLHHSLRTPVSKWLRVRFVDPMRKHSGS